MAYQSKEAKRNAAAAYRRENEEAIRLYRRAYYAANKEKIRGQQKARYEANKPKILAQQREYMKKRVEENGRAGLNVTRQAWREKNLDRERARAREHAAKSYRQDPIKAAKKRARTILSSQTGLPVRMLDSSLVEAKALQLLVRQQAAHPGRPVGYVATPEETRAKRSASFKAWYAKNKDARREYAKQYRDRFNELQRERRKKQREART